MRNQLRPLFDRVVIKELDPDRVRRSGLLVPPGTDEPPPQHGIVLAVGPGLDWWDHVGVQMPVKPGDHVVFPASAGAWVEVDEERLLVCRVGELLGVLERPSDCPACGGRPLAPQRVVPGVRARGLGRFLEPRACAAAGPRAATAQPRCGSTAPRAILTRASRSATSGSSPSASARRQASMHSASRSVRASAWA